MTIDLHQGRNDDTLGFDGSTIFERILEDYGEFTLSNDPSIPVEVSSPGVWHPIAVRFEGPDDLFESLRVSEFAGVEHEFEFVKDPDSGAWFLRGENDPNVWIKLTTPNRAGGPGTLKRRGLVDNQYLSDSYWFLSGFACGFLEGGVEAVTGTFGFITTVSIWSNPVNQAFLIYKFATDQETREVVIGGVTIGIETVKVLGSLVYSVGSKATEDYVDFHISLLTGDTEYRQQLGDEYFSMVTASLEGLRMICRHFVEKIKKDLDSKDIDEIGKACGRGVFEIVTLFFVSSKAPTLAGAADGLDVVKAYRMGRVSKSDILTEMANTEVAQLIDASDDLLDLDVLFSSSKCAFRRAH